METVADPVVRKVKFSIAVLSDEEKARMLDENVEKARRDEEAARAFAIKEAKEKNKEEGREIGIAETRKEFIRNLLQSEFQIDRIAQLVGLTIKEVEQIVKELDL